MSDSGWRGPRFVLLLYALLVGVGGVAGALVALSVARVEAPRLLFLIRLPASPLGFAVYGAVTVAVVLGVPLALVVYVSRGIEGAE